MQSDRQCTTAIVKMAEELFNKKDCYELAKRAGFIQRSSSRIQGHDFLKMMVIPSEGLAEDSLGGLVVRLKQFNPGADLSAPGLCQRINSASCVALMKVFFLTLLRFSQKQIMSQEPDLEGALNCFARVLLQDSTVCQLSERLGQDFPGTRSCIAQVKIDYIHDLIKGEFVDVGVCAGNVPDQGLSQRLIGHLRPGDLTIRDLGYFNLSVFRQIVEAGAYFLTRLPPHVKVYLNAKDSQPVDLAAYVNKKHRYLKMIDINVFIGDERLPARLVLYRVPKHVREKRRRDANKRAKDCGREMSHSKKALMDFAIFATNVPADILSSDLVGAVYRIRWEIELIFKQWKSLLKIQALRGFGPHRINCLIWARLCTALYVAMISSHFMKRAQGMCQGELSPVKLIKYLLRSDILYQAFARCRVEEVVGQTTVALPTLLKDKRRQKTMRQRITDSEGYYEDHRVA